MRVYIAAPWKHKQAARLVRQQLELRGLDVTSRWLDFEGGSAYEHTDVVMRREAIRDIEDIHLSDEILYLNLDKSEGKATELGMAIALDIPVTVVGGKQNNVFLHLPQITHADSVEEFIGQAHVRRV